MTRTADPAPSPGARANPFVGISETALRFVLLSAATLAAAEYAWQYIAEVPRSAVQTRASLCVEVSTTTPSPPYSSEHARCWAENQAYPVAADIGIGLGLTVLGTLVILVVVPAVRAIQRGLADFDPSIGPEIPAVVDDLAGVLRIRVPRLLLDPQSGGTARMVAGGLHGGALVIGPELALLHRRRPSQFRAVIAHELSHVRNTDVRLAEIATAAWLALILLVVVPYLVVVILNGDMVAVAVQLVKFGAVIAAVRLLRSALLRSREYEADIRASTLDRVRADLPETLASGRARAHRPWSSHPPVRRRIEVLAQPAALLNTRWSDIFTLAAIGYFSLPAARSLLQLLAYGRASQSDLTSAADWLVALGIGAGIWALAWRQAVAEGCFGAPRFRALPSAITLCTGLSVGAILTPLPRAAVGVIDEHTPPQWLGVLAGTVVASVLVLSVAQIFARLFLARATTVWRGRVLNVVGLAAAVALTGALLDVGQVYLLASQPDLPAWVAPAMAAGVIWLNLPGWFGLVVAFIATNLLVRRLPRTPAGAVPAWAVLPDAGAAGRS